jgi:RNA polymerase sigma factor (sigma-70 family)
MNDLELLQEYHREGSDAAFAELVRRHLNLVYSAALRHAGIAAHAEEIAQAVFIILARKAAGLRPDTVLAAWLHETTRLTARHFQRGERRRQIREQEAYMQSTLNQAEPPAWDQLKPLLDDALSHLGKKDREAVVLRFLGEKTLGEVAAVLNVSEAAAQSRVHRALEKLRRWLGKRGVTLTAAAISGALYAHSAQAAPVGLAQTISAVAAAKGVAAGTSTLTLTKGALKIMAWTKMKTAVLVGVGVLLAAGSATMAVKAVNAARTRSALAMMQGNWEGALTINQVQLRLVLRMFETNGTYQAMIDSVDQGAKNIPVTRLLARTDSIHLELPALDGVYQAALNGDKTEMSGTWTQLKHAFPLILKRTTEADQVAEPMTADQYAAKPNSDLQGAWEGTLKVGSMDFRLNLRIAEPVEGTFQAQMDSVDQGAKDMPVTAVTYQKPAVHFEMAAIHGVFEGSVNRRADQMSGTWTQFGKTLPLTFQRAKADAQAAADEGKDYGQGLKTQVQGHWKGALDLKKVLLHIVIHIAQMPDGSYSATMDSPDQGASGIPATMAEFTYPNLRLEWKGFAGVYDGKLEKGRLSGMWHQGATAFPLKLERGAAE